MSDVQAAEPSDESGQVEAGETDAQPVEAPHVDFIDLDQYSDYHVPITVDGEEQNVPLAELRNGYQRQADYTRKTQELAADRERLQQAENISRALENDPEGTLRVLQAAFEGRQSDNQEPEFLDPIEREVHELKSWKEQQEMQAAEAGVAQQLEYYHTEHGVDPNELVQFALDNKIPRLDWALWGFQQGKQEAATEFKQRSVDAEASRIEAKRGAVGVEGGQGRATGSVVAPTSGHGSLQEAYQAAKSQLGYG